MHSADVEISLADGAPVTANVSSPLSKSVTGTKRSRENDEECEVWRLKTLQLPPLVLKEGAGTAAAAQPAQVAAV